MVDPARLKRIDKCYCTGFIVVSGGIFLAVSAGVVAVSDGAIVVSIAVLSVDPETLLVELHADAPINIVPAKARLKINFFIGIDVVVL